jgi:hypothetical protein
MKESNLFFKDFKFRCHRLGDLMTNLPGLTAAESKKLDTLTKRETDFKAGKAKELTPTMENDLKELIIKRDKEDSLPTGAKSYLDTVFDDLFWRRKRILGNKYLDKGLMNEQDVLELHSQIDGNTYWKNTEQFENEYVKGMPDNIYKPEEKVKDAKANFDLESFRKADLNSTYLWQGKGYMWLTGLKKFELMYGLVNNPLHQIHNAITSAYYALGCPDDDNEIFLSVKQQIERNMIFDSKLFIEEYPQYTFLNPVLDFDIPAVHRVKKFQVELTEDDIYHMKSRVLLARIYLCQKEIEVYKMSGQLIEMGK